MSEPTFSDIVGVVAEPYSSDELIAMLQARDASQGDTRLYATTLLALLAVRDLSDCVDSLETRMRLLLQVEEDRIEHDETQQTRFGIESHHCAAIQSAAITSVSSLAAVTSEIDRRVLALERIADQRLKTAQALGKQGGDARALSLSAEERSNLARHAVQARWRKQKAGTETP
jgi:hypothetical protein